MVNERPCPRCHALLRFPEEGSLIYCWNCGAPQVTLSEDLSSQAEQQKRAFISGVAPEALDGDAGSPVSWTTAIRCAVLSGVVAAALLVISFVAPPVLLLAGLWAIGAPVVALGVYSARAKQSQVRPGFGARLGLLCGLFIVLGMAIVNVGGLVLSRYAFHNAAQLDGQLATLFNQMRTNLQTQGGAAAAPMLEWLKIPQFRAGLLLSFSGIFGIFYLVLSAAGGAFAGLLRSRGEPR